MSNINSDLVKQHIEARTCDVTPVSVNSAARILYMPVSHDPWFTENCKSVLSSDEVHRARRFNSQDDAKLFKQRRAFRRYCAAVALGSSQQLHRFDFSETKKGRPHLPDLPAIWFSFSSCQSGFLGAWSSSHGIGVDLEEESRSLKPLELAEQYFSVNETKSIKKLQDEERLQLFLQYWSLKEAALKSIGEGLPFGLDGFEFELTPNPKLVQAPLKFGGSGNFDAQLIGIPCRFAAVVTRQLN